MNVCRKLSLLAFTLLVTGCAGMPGQEIETQDEQQLLCAELRKAEDEKQRLKQLLAERQRQLRDEQRKVEELTGKVAELEKKVAALRQIDRETLQRAIRK